MHNGAIDLIYQRARELRNMSTNAEELLWCYLKTKPLGYKFRRQHPYGVYIFDFYCHKAKLVIEVDGSIHENEDVKLYDRERQHHIESDGLSVVRFRNEEIETQIEHVISRIETFLKQDSNASI
jgi:cyclase